MPPLVTIVITTHNRPHLVGRAIRSALAQSFRAIEVIVVDDASDPAFLPEGFDDQRLKVVRREGPGRVSRARNSGLREAKGRWITFLDDDDMYVPTMVEASLRAAESTTMPRPVAVLSALAFLDEAGNPRTVRMPVPLARPVGFLTEQLHRGRWLPHNTLFSEAQLLRDLGGYDEDLPAREDVDLIVRLNRVCSIDAVTEVTYHKLPHSGPRITHSPVPMSRAIDLFIAKHREPLSNDPRALSRLLSQAGIIHLLAGRWAHAVATTGRAVRYWPTRPKGIAAFLLALAGPRALQVAGRLRLPGLHLGGGRARIRR